MISRAAAAEIAKSEALAHGLGRDVSSVVLLEEINGRSPVLYNVSLENCWVAYVEQDGQPALRPSIIVVVERTHGNVIYRGTANDEG